MKIATFNINGIRSRLPALLDWLDKEAPDVVCLQELKAPDAGFPEAELRDAGYGAIWHGQVSWNGVAILARGSKPIETRRGLPGGAADTHSRYLEAAVNGVLVGCLYLPNGNPQPGPKFDYKLEWFERLIAYAKTLYESGHPVVLAGDYNVVPTDVDIYNTRSWLKDALLQPESRECYARLLAQGWTDAIRTQFPDEKIFTFWDYFRRHWDTNSGLRIDHLLLSESVASRLRNAGVDRWVRGQPHASDHAPTWIELNIEADVDVDAVDVAVKVGRKASAGKVAVKEGASKDTPVRSAASKLGATGKKLARKSVVKEAAEKASAAEKVAVKKVAAKKVAAKKVAAKEAATKKVATKKNTAAAPSAKKATLAKTKTAESKSARKTRG